jgi:hypothetical protein
VKDKISYPCKTTDKIIVSYILIFMFLGIRIGKKDWELNGSKYCLNPI